MILYHYNKEIPRDQFETIRAEMEKASDRIKNSKQLTHEVLFNVKKSRLDDNLQPVIENNPPLDIEKMDALSLGFGAAEPFDESQIPNIAFDYYKKIGLLDMVTIEEISTKLAETKSLIERIKNEGVEKVFFIDTPAIPGFESYMVGFLEDSVLIMEKILQYLEAERRTDGE